MNFRGNPHSVVCLNVKELLARSRRHIWSFSDCNVIRTHNHWVRKRTLNHLGCGLESRCFHFLCFWPEIPFLGKFGPKNQNYQFKLKFGTYTNSNMQNSMVMFIFFVFDWKYPFWANLVQKVKIISLSWNLVPTVIQLCRV